MLQRWECRDRKVNGHGHRAD